MKKEIKTDAKLNPEKELTLYIVRHGKTFFNMTDQVQGFSDSPLTDEGVSQAIKLGENMKDIEFISAWTSDLGRQRATAKHILSKNKNNIPSFAELYGLREWNFGGFEGGENSAVWKTIFKNRLIDAGNNTDNKDLLQIYKKWIKSVGDRGFSEAIYEADKMKRAEKYDEILDRVKKAMEAIISQSLAICDEKKINQGNILVVSSGCLIRTLLFTFAPGVYLGGDILNCSVSILKYKSNKFTLKTSNDMSFLGIS
jgi:probable phosphoglycerate mutase